MITKITDHVARAIARLPEQYKDKPNLRALISIHADRAQTIEDAIYDLSTKRSLDEAEGIQLDRLGSIVGISRLNGEDDDMYRLKIRARVLVNISNGEPEILIQIYKLLTNASFVIYQEYYPAGVGLYSDGDIPDQGSVNLIESLLEEAASGGVRIDAMGKFDPDTPFAFDGDLLPGFGFGDGSDPAVGGFFAEGFILGPEFAMDGNNTTYGGFGSSDDPLVGGRLVSS